MARLQDIGYTTELPSEETGMKRYALTAKGKTLFEKQISFGQKLLKKLEFLAPLIVGGFHFDPNDEKILSGVREPTKRGVMTILDLRAVKKYRLTEQDTKEIKQILNKCADELEEILKRINEEKQV